MEYDLPAEREENVEEERKLDSDGYKGFLYIKCQHCGKIKGFCPRERIRYHQCECSSRTPLENLVPLYTQCECGRSFKYMTNMTDPMFDVTCIECGAPVTVEWDRNKQIYKTIRG